MEKITAEDLKINGLLLKFLEKQTEELCLTAVQQNGLALKFVKEQTPKICIAAAKQNRDAIPYVKDKLLRMKLEEESDQIMLHPNMSLDEVIALAEKTKTVRPPSGSFASEMKMRGR